MFIITHDLEAALICDKVAILKDGRLLEFDTPNNLIRSLPSEGLIARFSIDNLNKEKIKIVKSFLGVEKLIRVGNDAIEVFLKDFEENLPKLFQFLIDNGLKINSMSRDIAFFRRYFQIRIQEDKKEESLRTRINIVNRGGNP